MDKHSNLLAHSLVTKNIKCCEYSPAYIGKLPKSKEKMFYNIETFSVPLPILKDPKYKTFYARNL